MYGDLEGVRAENDHPSNFLAFGTILCFYNLWLRRKARFIFSPYPLKISIHLPLFNKSYALCMSRKTRNNGS